MAEPFLTPEGLQQYRSGDETLLLEAAQGEIRDYCGWHIAPSETVTNASVRIGERGLILLPTLHLTAVGQVQVDGRTLVYGVDYDWDKVGYISRLVPSWPRHRVATVTYTHGYAEIPPNVAVIGYELAQRAMDTVGGNTKDFNAGPYRMSLRSLGVELDESQRRRLEEGGYVRPGVR